MAFGNKVGSIKDLKKQVERGSGTFIRYIPKDGALTVRFLEEPDEWVSFKEVFDEVRRKSYPVPDEGMPGYPDPDQRVSTRYLVNAVDVDNDRCIPLQLPKDLVNQLVVRYERADTLMDRDFELFRSGSGLDTIYGVTPEAPSNRKLTKYKPLDLEQVLQDAYEQVWGSNGLTDGAIKKKKGPGGGEVKQGRALKRRQAEEVDEDEPTMADLVEAADEQDDADAATALSDMAVEAGVDPEEYDTWAEVAKAIEGASEPEPDDEDEDDGEKVPDLDALGEAADEGDDDAIADLTRQAELSDIDPDEYDTWAGVAAAITQSAADDVDGDTSDGGYDEDTLQGMAIGPLRALARDEGIKTTGMKKGQIIAALMAQGEDSDPDEETEF